MTSAEHDRLMRANQANWDARTPVHLASRFYGLDQDLDPERWFAPFEWEDLGELAGRDVLHLQCHLGTETIAFARRGARAVGLDFSAASVAAAQDIAARAGADVTYVRANVYDAVEALDGRRFDVVYTGKGALCYLPDLDRWADTVGGSCAPAAGCTSSSSTPCSTRSARSPPRARDPSCSCATTTWAAPDRCTATGPTPTRTARPSSAPRTATSGCTEWARSSTR